MENPNSDTFGKGDKGPMSKNAIPGCLPDSLSPIFYFDFNGYNLRQDLTPNRCKGEYSIARGYNLGLLKGL